MNKFTLHFDNPELETRFGNYLIQQQKARILKFLLFSVFSGLLAGALQLVQEQIIIGVCFLIWMLCSIVAYLYLKKHDEYAKQLSYFLNVGGLIIPVVFYWVVIRNLYISEIQKIVYLWANNLTIHYLFIYSNFIMNLVIYCLLIVMNIVSFHYLYGFDHILVIYGVYAMFWLTIEHQRLCEQRQLFKQSLVNQSIKQIIHENVRDNLIVFTYDSENMKFNTEICNLSAIAHLQTDNLSCILSSIHIYTKNNTETLSNYIAKEYLRSPIQNQAQTQVLQGYYKHKSDKLQLTLIVQQVPRLKFIINFTTLNSKQQLRKGQSLFMVKYQILTVNILNLIQQFIQKFETSRVCLPNLKKMLATYNKKLTLLNVLHSYNYRFTISEYSIDQQFQCLANEYGSKFGRISVQCQDIMITSDRVLTGLLLQLVIEQIHRNNFVPSLVRPQLNLRMRYSDSREFVEIGLSYSKHINIWEGDKGQKVYTQFQQIIKLVGDYNSIIINQGYLYFDILSQLEIPYKELFDQ